MYRIVYTSTAKSLMNERALQQVLRASRRNNAMELITGLLVYHDGCFLQVLEGPQAAVDARYAKIVQDPRHHTCIKLAGEHAVSRLFSEWWMSYCAHEDLPNFQQKQFLSLTELAKGAQGGELLSDLKTNAILLAFLSAFREFEMTG